MDHCGEWDLSSVQPRRRSSEPQVVTAQLVDRPAGHQLHVAFDFGSEIFKRPFNAGVISSTKLTFRGARAPQRRPSTSFSLASLW